MISDSDRMLAERLKSLMIEQGVPVYRVIAEEALSKAEEIVDSVASHLKDKRILEQ
jgi:hypothetical protein